MHIGTPFKDGEWVGSFVLQSAVIVGIDPFSFVRCYCIRSESERTISFFRVMLSSTRRTY